MCLGWAETICAQIQNRLQQVDSCPYVRRQHSPRTRGALCGEDYLYDKSKPMLWTGSQMTPWSPAPTDALVF